MKDSGDQSILSLKRLTERVSAGGSLDDVLNFIYDEFRSVIPYDRMGFAELTPDGLRAVARWARSNRELRLTKGFEASLAGSSLQLLLESKKSRVLTDLQAYLDNHPQSLSTRRIVEEGFRSSLTCPLVVEAKAVGFLFFTSVAPNTYSTAHTAMYEQIAGQLSLQILLAQERDRSRKTLSATVMLLMSLLEMINPTACGQATRVRLVVQLLTRALDLDNAWEVELAALLCRLGFLTVPTKIIDRHIQRESLTEKERGLLLSCTNTSYELLAKIPQFKRLAEIVRRQEEDFDPACKSDESVRFAASVLRAAVDFDACREQGLTPHGALSEMRQHVSRYAPTILEALESTFAVDQESVVHRDVKVDELVPGMRLEQHVETVRGTRLISSGHVITDALIYRLRHTARTESVREPIAVEVRVSASARQTDKTLANDSHSLDLVS